MRNFETDFDFDLDYFENEAKVVKTRDMRHDVYPTVIGDKTEWTDNAERKARISAHTERVQREMKELGILNERG